MKVFLVSESGTGINFFPELEALLARRIAGLDCRSIFVPFPEDIPAAVKQVVSEADLIFVFVLYDELDFRIKALLDKLIELDMSSKAKIVKVIEESEFEGLDRARLEREKQKLAGKWSSFIVDLLFNPDSFRPKERR